VSHARATVVPERRARSAAQTMRWLVIDASIPVTTGVASPSATAVRNVRISSSSPSSCSGRPSPGVSVSTALSGWPRKSWKRSVRPSPSMAPWVPNTRVWRGASSENAVTVCVAVIPLSNSKATTWWSTTSLSQR
jgi:hypothetical protein